MQGDRIPSRGGGGGGERPKKGGKLAFYSFLSLSLFFTFFVCQLGVWSCFLFPVSFFLIHFLIRFLIQFFFFFFYVDITSSLPGAHGYQLIWPLTFDLDPKGHMKKRRQNRNLHLETRKINKVRIFSHPCLAPMDTNLFDPWPLTLTPKVIWKNGAKIETYTWRPGKSIKFEFFLTPAWRPWIPTYLTPDLWPWPQRSYEKMAPKSKLTPGDQENQ